MNLSYSFVGQKSETVLIALKSRCWPGCVPFCRLYGKICFLIIQVAGRNQFLCIQDQGLHFLAGCFVNGGPFLVSRNHCIPLGSWPPGSIFKGSSAGLDAMSPLSDLSSVTSVSDSARKWSSKKVEPFYPVSCMDIPG